MEINKNNYPEVLIDYLDGKLNTLQVAEVLLFLEQNPEIKNEFEGLNQAVLKIEKASLLNDEKLELKKNYTEKYIGETAIDELIIGQMEGDLSTQMSLQVDELIKHNESFNKLKNIFFLTKIKPDLNIKYKSKRALKRKTPIILLYRNIAIAASLLLLIGFSFLTYNHSQNMMVDTEKGLVNVANNSKQKITDKKTESMVAISNENVFIDEGKRKTKIDIDEKVSTPRKSNYAIKQTIAKSTIDVVHEKQFIELLQTKPMASITVINPLVDIAFNSAEKQLLPMSITGQTMDDTTPEYPSLATIIKNKILKRGKNHLHENNVPSDRKENIDAMHIASAGADVLNKATGANISFKRNYDNKGLVKSFAIVAGRFSFERIK